MWYVNGVWKYDLKCEIKQEFRWAISILFERILVPVRYLAWRTSKWNSEAQCEVEDKIGD